MCQERLKFFKTVFAKKMHSYNTMKLLEAILCSTQYVNNITFNFFLPKPTPMKILQNIADPASRVRKITDPGSGSASKNFLIIKPVSKLSGMFFPDPGLFFHDGSRGKKITGSQIHNTAHTTMFSERPYLGHWRLPVPYTLRNKTSK
jgi:hypothetical protein